MSRLEADDIRIGVATSVVFVPSASRSVSGAEEDVWLDPPYTLLNPIRDDYGPVDLGRTVEFCKQLEDRVRQVQVRRGPSGAVCVRALCRPDTRDWTVYTTLLACYAVLAHRKTPDEAWQPFAKYGSGKFLGAVAGSPGVSPLAVLRGLQRAVALSWVSLSRFDVDRFSMLRQQIDFTWIVPDQIAAMSDPAEWISKPGSGRSQDYFLELRRGTMTSESYLSLLRRERVSCVVRMNERRYDDAEFQRAGITVEELPLPDMSCPPLSAVGQFLDLCKRNPGGIACHCRAGLGRTGFLVAAYCMVHYRFSASDALGWLRLCRPGAVLGSQEGHLLQMEAAIMRLTKGAPLGYSASTWGREADLYSSSSRPEPRDFLEPDREASTRAARTARSPERMYSETTYERPWSPATKPEIQASPRPSTTSRSPERMYSESTYERPWSSSPKKEVELSPRVPLTSPRRERSLGRGDPRNVSMRTWVRPSERVGGVSWRDRYGDDRLGSFADDRPQGTERHQSSRTQLDRAADVDSWSKPAAPERGRDLEWSSRKAPSRSSSPATRRPIGGTGVGDYTEAWSSRKSEDVDPAPRSVTTDATPVPTFLHPSRDPRGASTASVYSRATDDPVPTAQSEEERLRRRLFQEDRANAPWFSAYAPRRTDPDSGSKGALESHRSLTSPDRPTTMGLTSAAGRASPDRPTALAAGRASPDRPATTGRAATRVTSPTRSSSTAGLHRGDSVARGDARRSQPGTPGGADPAARDGLYSRADSAARDGLGTSYGRADPAARDALGASSYSRTEPAARGAAAYSPGSPLRDSATLYSSPGRSSTDDGRQRYSSFWYQAGGDTYDGSPGSDRYSTAYSALPRSDHHDAHDARRPSAADPYDARRPAATDPYDARRPAAADPYDARRPAAADPYDARRPAAEDRWQADPARDAGWSPSRDPASWDHAGGGRPGARPDPAASAVTWARIQARASEEPRRHASYGGGRARLWDDGDRYRREADAEVERYRDMQWLARETTRRWDDPYVPFGVGHSGYVSRY